MTELHCLCRRCTRDIRPTVHHEPPTRRVGTPDKILRQLQARRTDDQARAEVYGHGVAPGVEQRFDPVDGVDPLEFAVGTDDVQSGNRYLNRSPS